MANRTSSGGCLGMVYNPRIEIELRLRGKLILERDALELLGEVPDPVFRLLAIRHRHESCDGVRPAGRAEHAFLGAIKNDLTDLELVRHLSGHRRPRSPAQDR